MSADLVQLRRWNCNGDRETRLERVFLSDIADLVDVGLNQFKPIPFNSPAPLSQEIIDAASCRPDPMQLEMKACRRVMDDVMMQDHRLGLVALLLTSPLMMLHENEVKSLYLLRIYINYCTLTQEKQAFLRPLPGLEGSWRIRPTGAGIFMLRRA